MNVSNINDLRMTYCEMPTNRFNADCISNNLGGGGRMTFCEMPDNRFNADCISNNLGGDGRTTFCEMPANIFTHEDCKKISNINNIRMTFCEMPDNRFNADCITNNLGGGGRTTFCEMPDNRFNADCISNNLGGGGRTTFCEMPANIFTHEDCKKISNINNIRMTFCEMPDNRFNQGCIDGGLGGGGRTTFCNMSANLFNQDCLDNDLGDDTARDPACLTSPKGDPAHESCRADRPGVITACQMNPFSTTNTGCENLDTIISIREVHCGTAANFEGRCTVDYDDWKDSFNTAPPTRPSTTTGEQTNRFLNAGIDALDDAVTAFAEQMEAVQVVESDTLNLDGTTSNPTANSVSYLSVEDKMDNTKRYYYAGLDSRADLGAPSFQETGTALWVGKFGVTVGNTKTSSDFELEITFGGAGDVAGSIAAFVPSSTNHFLLTGDYDENGVISGTVNFGAFTDGNRTVPTE